MRSTTFAICFTERRGNRPDRRRRAGAGESSPSNADACAAAPELMVPRARPDAPDINSDKDAPRIASTTLAANVDANSPRRLRREAVMGDE
jgi:hypothetical protein